MIDFRWTETKDETPNGRKVDPVLLALRTHRIGETIGHELVVGIDLLHLRCQWNQFINLNGVIAGLALQKESFHHTKR